MEQSLHLLNCFWNLSPWSVTSECLDVPVSLRSGQFQWMANLRIRVRALREKSEEYTLDFPPPRKDCSFMSPLPSRLSFMSFVMKPLHPLLLRFGDYLLCEGRSWGQSTYLDLDYNCCSGSWHGNQDLGQNSSWPFQGRYICRSPWVDQKMQEGCWDILALVEFADATYDRYNMCGKFNSCDKCNTM